MKKPILWTLAGTGSFLVSLAILAPLPVLAQQLMRVMPELQLAGVSGTLWQGKVQRVTLPQAQVDDLSWQLAPRQLLSGRLAAEMEGTVQGSLQAKGLCGVTFTTNLACAPLSLDLAAAEVGKVIPAAQTLPATLGGTLRARLDQVQWDRQNLPELGGQISWEDGSIDQPIQLKLGGNYQARIKPANKAGQALDITLMSNDAMVVLDGKISVETNGRYLAEVFLKPSAAADPSIAQGLSLLGAPQNDGSIRLKQEGQVTLPGMATPAAP